LQRFGRSFNGLAKLPTFLQTAAKIRMVAGPRLCDNKKNAEASEGSNAGNTLIVAAHRTVRLIRW
jgi:hypothetical protein